MIITEELRTKILLHLPKDYQKQCATKTGYSRSMIYKVLHEGHENETISGWLIKTANKLKKDRESEHKKQLALVQQLSAAPIS